MNVTEILAEMASILPARRGSVHEQFIERADAHGRRVKFGPYYVYTRYVEGKTVSQRISKEEFAAFSEEIERGKRLLALIEKLWEVTEAQVAHMDAKKKRHLRKSKQVPLS